MILIEGKIKGKDRPRFYRGHTVTPKATKDYEKLVKGCYIEQGGKLFLEAVKVNITVKHKLPKKPKGIYPTKRPDIDNIAKIILDGLNGVAYKDDAQVIKLFITKKWTTSIECIELEVKEYKE